MEQNIINEAISLRHEANFKAKCVESTKKTIAALEAELALHKQRLAVRRQHSLKARMVYLEYLVANDLGCDEETGVTTDISIF